MSTSGAASPGTAVPAYTLSSTSPISTPFTWYPIQNLITTEKKWGGYFVIPPPPVTSPPTTYTTQVPLPLKPDVIGCAGCAKNDPGNGYDAGGITLQITAVSATSYVASCSLTIKVDGANTITIDGGHFYASFTPPRTFAPGQFPPAATVGLPGSEGGVVAQTAVVGGTPGGVIYLACHWGVTKCPGN
ncbi:hypothetical protein HYH03_006210 [Edaphochlamys debaryana]|uniref:Uncharacterized protein n=1 Tax=Edaphochlamys debaryana TaxID=47281 RepID=A0A836C0D3_9CHLO|nr:hypothetical protein HYH03_006210 [Edaphochlamys debaryana]|eukprot:KAG2495610.1 hypothetical protein HYH03_006210 [Edaphochlamys debaryana]